MIDPNSGKPLKDENGNVVIDEATGKPKKDPKTMKPYIVLDDIHEIEALPGRPRKGTPSGIHPALQADAHPSAGLRALLQQHLQLHDQVV